MKRRLCIPGIFTIVLLLSSLCWAQDTASLTGTIRDKSGAVIPGASITIRNSATGTARELVSNSVGEYLAAALPPGRYDIFVTAQGFRQYQATGVVLGVAQNARIGVTLQVGDVNTQVVVQGDELARVNTQTSELGGTITGKEVTQLQLNGRNFTQLITLVPGVSNQTGQDEGVVGVQGNVGYSVNGGRKENNNWEVDGGDIMDNGSNGSLNVYPSIEAIDEVEVLTSSYGAQYGKNGSGTVEVETKSGTNRFHGSAYEFLRNEAFNARNYFEVADSRKPQYRKNDFGYTLGGPIVKNHTFFFWSEEWRRENVPQDFYSSVPSIENTQGNFNDVCNVDEPTDCPSDPDTGDPFPDNQLPSIDPNAKILLGMLPAPTTGSGVTSYLAESVAQPMHWREELFRGDHNFNSKLAATFRYIHDAWDVRNPVSPWSDFASFPTIGAHFIGPGVSMVAKVTATISPTLLNEFVAGYTTDKIQQINTNPAVWTRGSDFTMTGLFPDFQGKLPNFCLSTNGAYGGGFCEGPGAFPWNNSNPTYTYRDNLSKSLGRHNLQIGGYFAAAQKNETASVNVEGDLTFDSTSPVSTGNAYADLLTGRIANFSQDSSQPKYYIRYKFLEPYVQDDFHVSKRLTLNLGVRVSLFGTFREMKKQVYNWDPKAYDPSKAPQIDLDGSATGQQGALIETAGTTSFDGIVQCGNGSVPLSCMNEHLLNPAPRVGFAWDPLGNGKMSLRGGYGVFFDHTNGEEGNAESLEGTPPLVQEPTQYNVVGYTSIGGQSLLFPQSAISIPSDHAIWPYVQQWHLDVQSDLTHDMVATLSYVGNKGTHLTLQRELNQLHPIASSQNPFHAGQPIQGEDCQTWNNDQVDPQFTVNGATVTGQAAINLLIACGNDPNPYRPYYSLGSIQRVEPQANSNYNALQFSLRRTADPLTLDVAYSYSHALDNSSDKADGNFVDSYNLKKNYASSSLDQRHILSISWIYNLPFFRNAGISHSTLGGWQYAGIMNMHSNGPFSVGNGIYGDSAGVANGIGTGSYADRIGDPHAVPADKYSSSSKGPLLFNPDAYTQTRGLTFGDSGRNSLNLPHRTNFDMSIYKIFKPADKVDVQLRAEAFNVFNHTQFSSVNGGVGTNNFMRAGSAHEARVVQFGVKLMY